MPSIKVRAQIGAGVVRLEVEDRGTTGSIARRAPDLHGQRGGFGLNVVERLSARWGVNPTPAPAFGPSSPSRPADRSEDTPCSPRRRTGGPTHARTPRPLWPPRR